MEQADAEKAMKIVKAKSQGLRIGSISSAIAFWVMALSLCSPALALLSQPHDILNQDEEDYRNSYE